MSAAPLPLTLPALALESTATFTVAAALPGTVVPRTIFRTRLCTVAAAVNLAMGNVTLSLCRQTQVVGLEWRRTGRLVDQLSIGDVRADFVAVGVTIVGRGRVSVEVRIGASHCGENVRDVGWEHTEALL